MKRFLLLIGCLAVLSFTSCKMLRPTVMFQTDKNFHYSEFSDKPRVMVLQPFDQLEVIMSTNNGYLLLETDVNESNRLYNNRQGEKITYMIRQDSIVKIPTVGEIKLGGMTKDSAETILEQELAKYYQAPFVKITVTNRNVILFFDEGTEGYKISIPEGGITLMEAIADAGGLTESSKSYKIKLIRGNNKNPEVYNFNIRSLEEFKKANFMLETNDIVYVDSRPKYATKFVKEISPYLTLITCITMVYSIFR
ncbi:MAG: polysaccharide biosynthesis/export family protein [Bacteroidales bacterium]|nr:polysaccharide biosynthesis/export family protein [Bacteroidales bacterium]